MRREKREEKLGVDKVRAAIAQHSITERAKSMALEVPFIYDRAAIERALNRCDEMRVISLLERGFPEGKFVDPSHFLKFLEQNFYQIDLHSLLLLRRFQESIREVTAFFKKSKEESYPNLKELIKEIKLFPEIGRRIDLIIDRFGEVKDSASEELKTLRKSIRMREGRVSKEINALLKKGQREGIIESDATITVRDGRVLLPVSASHKRELPGLVVDQSSTGKTFYIEPIEIVELNNQLKELYFEQEREILRILAQFTDFLRPYQFELLESADLMVELDFIWAKARYAISIGAGKPVISKERELRLKEARHPLLQSTLKREGKEIVPLTLTLNSKRSLLLISGPNAGGKSVALKTVGLLQYMLQCGFLIPASESSEMMLFKEIFIDIGDEQSLENDLSTYSSHLKNMAYILERADRDSLLLIDEFGSGTEPTAGGAIAEAILEEIERRGSFGLITTHYGNLKLYASDSKGVVNGGMQFDIKEMRPLFKLEIGSPGSSFAFELAHKMGLPAHVVKSGEERAGTDYMEVERHLKKIARNRRAVEQHLSRVKHADKTLESITERYQRELSELQNLRREIIKEAKEEAASLLAESNRRIERTIKEIRESEADREKTKIARSSLSKFEETLHQERGGESDEKIAKKMEQLIARKERREKRRGEREGRAKKVITPKAVAREPIKKGDKVKVAGSNFVGELLEIEGKMASVAIGSVISKMALTKLEKISNRDYSNQVNREGRKSFSIVESDQIRERRMNFYPSIDLRGVRVEEALERVTHFIDDAIMIGVDQVRILHGKGNGVLREEIRKYLKSLWGLSNYRDEELSQGGAGVTIVELN